MTKYAVILMICALWVGCSDHKSSQELPVIDLAKPESTGRLKVSEILDNVRLIRLETRPEVLLPGFFFAWVSDKYIVTIGQEEIHLFDSDGKYIRKIAQHGRGPEEFRYVLGYCVDEQADRLYLSDGDNRICVIDLNEGRIIEKIPVRGGTPHKLLFTGNRNLTYIPIVGTDEEEYYEICSIKPDGTFVGGIRGDRQWDDSGMPYLGEINDTIHYKLSFCDTLFRMHDTLKIPYCRIVTERPYSKLTDEGNIVEVLFENSEKFIFSDTEMKVEKKDGVIITSASYMGFYMVGKSDFKLKKVSDFYIDILDYTYTERFPFLIAGKKAYRNINVSLFKEMMKDKLDSPLIVDSLKNLYNELAEDDNSLILVGDIKNK